MELNKPREWLYRASQAGEDLDGTRRIADEFGFICRSAFADAAKEQRIPHVKTVNFGDVIHLYFVGAGGGEAIGSYRVGLLGHERKERFGRGIAGPALREVVDPELIEVLRESYAPDPKLGVFTGWPVVKVDEKGPMYHPGLFPGNNALFEHPPPTSRRRSKK